MARYIRVEFGGAVYHVMARGNERRCVFRDDRDRRRFLETLEEMVERFGVRIHAYCLMPNHYHVLLETPRSNLSQAVGWLQVTYTVRFNRRHRRSGHLFQGRFKAQLVEADAYAQGLVEYIHLNPVRPRNKQQCIAAARAAELDRYRWSSHRAYAGLEKQSPGWLSLDWLRYWDEGDRAAAHRQYRLSVRRWFEQAMENPWEQLVGSLVLGTDKLLAKVNAQLRTKHVQVAADWVQRREDSLLREKLGAVLQAEPDERVKIWARLRLAGERGSAVAREYGYRDGSGVGHVMRRLERRSLQDRALRAKLMRLKEHMSSVQS